jgi:hypothetical protein
LLLHGEKGTGLRLFIANKTVEQQDERVIVTSAQRRGSLFRADLIIVII